LLIKFIKFFGSVLICGLKIHKKNPKIDHILISLNKTIYFMKKEIEILLRRAEGFMRDSLEDLRRGDYDLAMFHLEQACQLMIKAKILDLFGYYERTHSLRRLLSDLSNVFKKEEIEDFVERYWISLRNLEFAYITSRYLPEEFKKEEVEEALELYKKLREILWNS